MVGKMTLAEIATVLDQADRGPMGAPGLSDAELLAEACRWNTMTPLEKLRNMQR